MLENIADRMKRKDKQLYALKAAKQFSVNMKCHLHD